MKYKSVFAIFGLILILMIPPVSAQSIPDWVKNNAGWWAEGTITDSDFISGIQFLIAEGILSIPPTSVSSEQEEEIPDWVKNNAAWWADGLISDDDFINGIQFLIQIGLISVVEETPIQTLAGQFTDGDFIHRTSGTAILTIEGDKRTLEFENFETLNGPDLYVYLSGDKSASDFINLGRLDSFKGNQSYEIDNSVNLENYDNVLVWCKAFGVLFGSAELS